MKRALKYALNLSLIFFIVACTGEKKNETPAFNKKLSGEKLLEVNRILIKKDQQKIKGYISRKGWEMTETETGLWYEVLEKGTSLNAKVGMLATINYTLSLLDGKTCYSSDELGPKTFLIGKGNVESGLEQGILLLSEGSKARFILPPHLAYGLPGDGNCIPARAILLYEIELVSLSNP
jgi:FKBP-type peptidyl-prolyl cis-trans isomerase FkpA